MSQLRVRTLIVGGGPAGLAPLLAAGRLGLLDRLLADGVAVAEGGAALGRGSIGDYGIGSDSSARTFSSALAGLTDPRLAALAGHPFARELAALDNAAVPLAQVGRFQALLGQGMAAVLRERDCPVLTGHAALHAERERDGWRVILRRRTDGQLLRVQARAVLLATGGHQPWGRLRQEEVAGVRLLPRYGGRLMQSDTLLRPAGLAAAAARLAARPEPRVAIIGGSTSALAVAHALLQLPGIGGGGVTVLHRRPLRVFYPSARAALADGYAEFGTDDICPVSGFVYRLAGFRLASRELVMRARGIGGRTPEPRLVLHHLTPDGGREARAVLDRADLIVAALGYRPRALALRGLDGAPLALRAEHGGALVDDRCRVVAADGRPVPGMFAIGLAAGFRPSGALGGEPSFRGQANGLWLWQNDVGALIARQLAQGPAMAERAAVAA